MSVAIHRFPARLADLEFTMQMPDQFVEHAIEREDVDFADPATSVPLAVVASQIAMALITVSARPGYEHGSVEQWVRFLCDHHRLTITGLVSGFVGSAEPDGHLHPRVLIEAGQTQDGTPLSMRIVMLEDGQRIVIAHAMCPAELWASYGGTLERALLSLQLARPRGPTVPCVPGGPVPIVDMPGQQPGEWPRGRGAEVFDAAADEAALDAAIASARDLIAAGKYVEAEVCLTGTRRDVRSAAFLAALYRERLEQLVAEQSSSGEPEPEVVQEVFARALAAAMNAYPDPHTEVEAENYARGQAEDRAALIAIMNRRSPRDSRR